MNIGYAALLSFVIAMPALAEEKSSTKTSDGVEFQCGVTGSSNDGWSIWGPNTTTTKKTCNASCDLTDKSGKKETVKADSRPVNAASETGKKSQRFELSSNNGALKNPPYKSPVVTTASCKNS